MPHEQLQRFIAAVKRGEYTPQPGRKPARSVILCNMGLDDADLALVADALREHKTGIIEINASNDPTKENPNKFTDVIIYSLSELQILDLSHTGVTTIKIFGVPQLKMLKADQCNVARVTIAKTPCPEYCIFRHNGMHWLQDTSSEAITAEQLKRYLHYALLEYKIKIWPQVLTAACEIYLILLQLRENSSTAAPEFIKALPQINALPDDTLVLIALEKSNFKVGLTKYLKPIVDGLNQILSQHTAAISQATTAIKQEFCAKAAGKVATNPTVCQKILLFRDKRAETLASQQTQPAGVDFGLVPKARANLL